MSVRGRPTATGFTAIIKLVGTGPRGSRDLGFEEARTAMRLVEIRDDVGVRGPMHAVERLLDFFGARGFVIGYTHSPYSARILAALDRLGADRAVAVRGIEGSDVARPGRPTAIVSELVVAAREIRVPLDGRFEDRERGCAGVEP